MPCETGNGHLVSASKNNVSESFSLLGGVVVNSLGLDMNQGHRQQLPYEI